MTRDELVTRVEQWLSNRAAPSDVATWYVDRVQDGYNWLTTYRDPQNGRELRFSALEDHIQRTLSSGATNNFYANSTGVRTVLGIFNVTDGIRVDAKGRRFFMERSRTETGTVRYWCPWSQSGVEGYVVWRLPSSDTTVDEWVYKDAETLSAGSQVPVIPVDWHPVIAMAGAAIGAQLFGMPDRANELFQLATNAIATKRTPDEDSRQGGLRTFTLGPLIMSGGRVR